MHRHEVVKVHIWRKKEDGPTSSVKENEAWVWRLKSTRHEMEERKNQDIEVNPPTADARTASQSTESTQDPEGAMPGKRNRTIAKARPASQYMESKQEPEGGMRNKSNRTTRPVSRNTEKRNTEDPAWAKEYSSKRSPKDELRTGPIQPRFHMSWGPYWKGKANSRSFHSSSTPQSQLNGRGLSTPRPFRVHENENERFSFSRQSKLMAYEEDNFGLRQGRNSKGRDSYASSIIDQLPKQDFDQPRVEWSLDDSGSFGLCRAQFDQTATQNTYTHHAKCELATQHSAQRQQNTVAPFETESFGLRSNKVRHSDFPAPHTFPLPHLSSSQGFGLPQNKPGLDNSGSFGLRFNKTSYNDSSVSHARPPPQSSSSQGSSLSRDKISLDDANSFGLRSNKARHGDSSASHTRSPQPLSRQDSQDKANFNNLESFGLRFNRSRHGDSTASQGSLPRSQDLGLPQDKINLDDSGSFGLRRARRTEDCSSFADHERPKQQLRKRPEDADINSDNLGLSVSHGRNAAIDNNTLPGSCETPAGHHEFAAGTSNFYPHLDRPREEQHVERNFDSEPEISEYSPGFRTSLHRSTIIHRPRPTSFRPSIPLSQRGDSGDLSGKRTRDQLTSGDGSFGLQRSPVGGGWASSRRDVKTTSMDNSFCHAWEAASLNMSFGGSDNTSQPASAVVARPLHRRSAQLQKQLDDAAPSDSPMNSTQAHAVDDSTACDTDSSRDAWPLSTDVVKQRELSSINSSKRSPHTKPSASTETTRKPVIPFSERLRQSRVAITEQIVSQRRSPSMPMQSAIGRLSQFQNYKSPHTNGVFGAAQTLLGPPIIRTVAESHQSTESQSDMDQLPPRPKPSGLAHHAFKYPTFPISLDPTNDTDAWSRDRSA